MAQSEGVCEGRLKVGGLEKFGGRDGEILEQTGVGDLGPGLVG